LQEEIKEGRATTVEREGRVVKPKEMAAFAQEKAKAERAITKERGKVERGKVERAITKERAERGKVGKQKVGKQKMGKQKAARGTMERIKAGKARGEKARKVTISLVMTETNKTLLEVLARRERMRKGPSLIKKIKSVKIQRIFLIWG